MSERLELGKNPAVLDPRGTLKPHQIQLLRRVDRARTTKKINGGWRVGDVAHKFSTLRPLIALDLLYEDFWNGRHTLKISAAGRFVIDRLDLAGDGRKSN